MIIAALSWPAASIYIAVIAAVALVATVLIYAIFRTGQTAITSDNREQEATDRRHLSAPEV